MEQWRIHENLKHLCAYRGAKVTSAIGDAKNFNDVMGTKFYVQINATRGAEDIRGESDIIIVQFSSTRDIDSTMGKFAPLLARIIRERHAKIPCNIIFVPVAPLSNSMQAIIAAESKDGIFIENHVASRFSIIVPRNINVPPHTIVKPEEIAAIISHMHINMSDLPRLIASGQNPDPVAVWFGFRAGMVIRIVRDCGTAGKETVYRVCV